MCSSDLPAFAILICGSLLAVAVAAGVGAFFGKRGETAAVKRDIATIKQNLAEMTQATEKIKAEISGEEWLKQRRWQIKWDCYSKLAEDLGELATLLQEVRFILGRGPVPGLDQAAIDNKGHTQPSRRERRDGKASPLRFDRSHRYTR